MTLVHTDTASEIATITLENSHGNRINFAMREDLLAAVQQVAASAAKVLIVKGLGGDFCLGGDVRDWPGIPIETLTPRIKVFADALDMLRNLPIPTVASVQGGCMGGGFELALSCDFILAGASAKFTFPEAKLGIMTLQGGVIQMADRIGIAKALELVFLSDTVSAEKLKSWNVVNHVFEDFALQSATSTFAERLATGSSALHAATKNLMRTWRDGGTEAAMRSLYDISMPLFETLDVQAALSGAATAIIEGKPFPTAKFPGN